VAEHPNAELLRALFVAFRAGDVDTVRAVLAEDIVWHFPGRRGRLAGSHHGRTGALAFLGQVVELTEGTFGLDLEDVVANDRFAVAFFRGHGRRNGEKLDNPTCLKVRMEEGRAAEIWEYVWNLYEVDEFWT
jgi:ketosteroid isomerase-like protein